MKSQLFLPVLFCLLFAACGKDDDATTGETPLGDYAEMEVTVRLCGDAFCDSLLPVAGANIYLYHSEEARSEGTDAKYNGSTGMDGKVFFPQLFEVLEFWLLIQMPAPDGRTQEEYVKTVPRGKAFVDIVFEKN